MKFDMKEIVKKAIRPTGVYLPQFRGALDLEILDALDRLKIKYYVGRNLHLYITDKRLKGAA